MVRHWESWLLGAPRREGLARPRQGPERSRRKRCSSQPQSRWNLSLQPLLPPPALGQRWDLCSSPGSGLIIAWPGRHGVPRETVGSRQAGRLSLSQATGHTQGCTVEHPPQRSTPLPLAGGYRVRASAPELLPRLCFFSSLSSKSSCVIC